MNVPKAWTWLSWTRLSTLTVLFLLSVLPATAQDRNDSGDNYNNPDNSSQENSPQNDPPGRVARMNFSQGSVSFQPGGEGDWVEAVPNRPMTTGDNLWADKNSRGELHVGSTAIRIGGETSLTFLDLDDHTTQLRLAQGSVLLNVRHLDDDDSVEVDTPNLSFQVQNIGVYRVNVDPDGRATIIDVFHGRGEALGGGNNYTVVANQQAVFRGGSDEDNQPLSYDIESLPRDDDFDRWAWDRDRREDRSESASYVSREMTGYEDLDQYGRWSYDANYGHVWIPTAVDNGWAPYRSGHWAFVAPWGWTWVDDAPWGFAPFHYGRWCRVRETWAWIPGPVVVRPVYAPALVAFVGGGGFHFSASFGGGGGVAWFPLGPGEVYVPAYHVSRAYVNQVNVTNTVVNVTKVTNVYNTTIVNRNTTVINNNNTVINNNVTKIVYVNQTAPNAVTAVSHDTFVNARPVARNVVQVSQAEIQRAPVMHTVEAAPVRTSVMGPGRPTQVAPPAAIATRQVVAQRAPAPPPIPFAQRKDPLMSQPARPVAPPITRQPVAAQPMQQTPTPPNSMQQHPMPPRPNQPEPVTPRSAIQPQPEPVRPNMPNPNAPRPNVPKPDVPKPEAPRPVMEHPATVNPEGPRNQPIRPEPTRAPEPAPAARPPQPPNPLVKPAAPPQPKSPQQGQEEERKFNQWQQNQRSAPPRPPAKQEDPKDKQNDKQKDKPKDKKDQQHNR